MRQYRKPAWEHARQGRQPAYGGQTGRRRPRTSTGSGGFTLVEMLLVVAIIGIVSFISVPYFVNSMRGNRLRSASRTVVSMGKYARRMALLHQRDMNVSFRIGGNELSVQPVVTSAPSNMATGAFPMPAPEPELPLSPLIPDPDAETNRVAGTGWVSPSVSRTLDSVTIASAEIEDSLDEENPAACYRMNGTCSPYTVTLEDRQGARMVIAVDALGSPKVERLR